jgi:molecular chaperone DnaK (HSP70)
MKSCGIDLGTTNSCIFVVEGEGNRLICDDQGNPIFPSAVHVSRNGARSVGLAARNRMGEQPGPVVAIKRKMGSTETVTLGGREWTPVEVSAAILTFLKELAETQAGAVIDRAVVTVPAYFSHIQRQQTDEAGKAAGFRDVVTLLEPVAAALAYSLASDQETLRVFVYDLGGGTFDATLLEKDPHGGISVLAFGGDAFLGGEDVDARLATILRQKLTERGFRLDLDLERPEDFSRFQRLKFYAELAKKELSDKEEANLVRQGLFEDQEGNTVDLDLTVTRRELEDCSQDLIQRSIDASLATLDKAGVPLSSIDEVILVGGMSRMPLVQRQVAEAFQREPRLVDPDLIVARGAALKAAEVFGEQAVAGSGLRLELHYDRNTDQDRVRISGRLDRPLSGHTVYLLGGEDEMYQTMESTDRFSFESVPLMPSRENVFTLSIENAQENLVLEHEVRIVHSPSARRILRSPGSVVTKPIAIRTVGGSEVLLPENTALPHTVSHTFETADQSGRIVMPIWEGNHEVSRLEIENIPRDLKEGTHVVVSIQVHSDYRIEASAAVPEIDRSVQVDFRIEPVDTGKITPEFMRRELASLKEEARAAAAECSSETARDLFQVRLTALESQIDNELKEAEPNRSRLHEKLSEIRALISSLPKKDTSIALEPPFDDFSNRLADILSRAIETRHPNLPQVRPQIESLRDQAQEVWESRDPLAWRRIQEQLGAIARKLLPEMSPEEKAIGLAAWLITDQLPGLEAAAGGALTSQIQAIRSEIEEIFFNLQLLGMDPQAVFQKLLSVYRDSIQPLQKKLGLTTAAQPGTADPAAVQGLVRGRKES